MQKEHQRWCKYRDASQAYHYEEQNSIQMNVDVYSHLQNGQVKCFQLLVALRKDNNSYCLLSSTIVG